MPSYIERDLFGGAIVAKTRPDLLDASDVRQVPDTQEVLLYTENGISAITEILQAVEPSAPEEIAKFHFNSVAHDNDSLSSTVESTSVLPHGRAGDETPDAIVLKGEQLVKKFNRTTADRVKIYMAVFRVAAKEIDVVVTFNVPTDSVDGGAVGGQGLARAEEDFEAFVRSFTIKDFSLFA